MGGAQTGPLEVGVIALVPEAWSHQWMGRHQLLSRMPSHFHVVWVDPPHGLRETRWGLRNWLMLPRETGQRGLSRYVAPPWLPRLRGPSWLSAAMLRERVRGARRMLERRGCKLIILYVWRPSFARALEAGLHDVSCYHIADEYAFSDVEVPISEEERGLLESSDQVFIHAPIMMAKKGGFNRNTAFVPNGVNYRAFSSPAPIPDDLARIPRPILGYAGFVKRTLDWPLLTKLVDRRPDWSFVFVGAHRGRHVDMYVRGIKRRPNVHLLGDKTSEGLIPYSQHFDVCLLPYGDNAYARYYYPLKLHEYLASGRPVLATPTVDAVRQFAGVVDVASSVDDWERAIERALSAESNSPERRMARQAVAREHDWDRLLLRIVEPLLQRLLDAPAMARHPDLERACRARLDQVRRELGGPSSAMP